MRILKVCSIFLLLFLITACGDESSSKHDKTLTCSIYDETLGSESTMIAEFSNGGNDIETMEIITSMELGADLLDLMGADTLIDSVCAEYVEITGISCEGEVDGESLISTVKYDVSNIDKDYLEKDSFPLDDYNTIKADMETGGYECE